MDKVMKQRQQGVALPVMLIILMVMLISSVYLLKSSNSSTIASSNLAYDASLSMAVDLGLQTGFQSLQARSLLGKANLNTDYPVGGYVSNYDPTQAVTADGFWTGSATITVGTGSTAYTIEYVTHRACTTKNLSYDTAPNTCVATSANPLPAGSAVSAGASYAVDTETYTSAPQLHYIVTARLRGPRGGNVINQLVVLIDA